MKNLIFCLLALSIGTISCQKDDTPDPVTPPVDKYMSLTAGSTWNYELINNLPTTVTSTFTLTATGRDSTAEGKTYQILTNNSGSGNEYYNITASEYFNFRNLPTALGGSSVQYLYLNDNIAVNSSWSKPYPVTVSGIALVATITNTITEKGLNKTVKGIAYTDVIHITTTISVAIGGVPLPASALVTDIQSYYAPKVGLIASTNKIDLNFTGLSDHTDQQTNLISADIK